MFDQCLPHMRMSLPCKIPLKDVWISVWGLTFFTSLFVQVSDWDGCPGVCHIPCNWETEVSLSTIRCWEKINSSEKKLNQEYCDMGMDSNNCWLGNYCQSIESGGCPSTTGLEWWWFVRACLDNDYFEYLFSASGSDDGTSTFTCFEPYYQVVRRGQLDNFQTWNA